MISCVCSFVSALFYLLGFYFVLSRLIWAAIFLKQYYFINLKSTALRNGQRLLNRYKRAGDWAVVTGASDGIGFAIAEELAKNNKMNVLLISRNQKKLDEIAETFVKDYGVKAKGFAFDFSTKDNEDNKWSNLENELKSLKIAILVNNVGINYPSYTLFAAPSADNNKEGNSFTAGTIEKDMQIIDVNCKAIVRMSKYILQNHLLKARCGGIINLSSLAADYPSPFFTAYAATKAFDKAFSLSLEAEIRYLMMSLPNDNDDKDQDNYIDILTVTPGMVSTAMTEDNITKKRPKASFLCVDASETAAAVICQLGAPSITSSLLSKLISPFILTKFNTSRPSHSTSEEGSNSSKRLNKNNYLINTTVTLTEGHPNHSLANAVLNNLVPFEWLKDLIFFKILVYLFQRNEKKKTMNEAVTAEK